MESSSRPDLCVNVLPSLREAWKQSKAKIYEGYLPFLFFPFLSSQKHNFPINYSIRVYREEIFKLSNISRMVRITNLPPTRSDVDINVYKKRKKKQWGRFMHVMLNPPVKSLAPSDWHAWVFSIHAELNTFLSSLQRLKVEELDDLVLQRLWFQVNQGVLKKVQFEPFLFVFFL